MTIHNPTHLSRYVIAVQDLNTTFIILISNDGMAFQVLKIIMEQIGLYP